MSRYFFTLTCIFFILNISAQKAEVELSELIKAKDEQYDKLLMRQGDALYSVGSESNKSKTKEFFVTKNSLEDFRKLEQWRFEGFEFRKNNTILWKSFGNKAGVHLLFTSFDKKEDRKYLLHRLVDLEGNLGPVKVLSQMVSDKEDSRKFIVSFSPDSSKTLVYNDINRDEEGQKPLVTVYDDQFEEVWSNRFSNPFRDEQMFRPVSIKLSNSGRLFVLGYRARINESKRRASETDQYGIISLYDDEIKIHDLKPLGKIIHMIGMQPDVNGKLTVVGLYSEDVDSHISGSLCLTFDQDDLEPLESQTRPFSEEFLSNFNFDNFRLIGNLKGMFSKVARSAKPGFEAFGFNEFLTHDDGGLTAVASRHYVEHTMSQGIAWTYHYFDEILIMHFNYDGSMDWISLVPRQQSLTEDDYIGYFYLQMEGDNLHVILNDNHENEERVANGEEMLRFTGSGTSNLATVHLTFDINSGEWTYKTLTMAKQVDKTFAVPVETIRTGEKKAVGVYKDPAGTQLRFVRYHF